MLRRTKRIWGGLLSAAMILTPVVAQAAAPAAPAAPAAGPATTRAATEPAAEQNPVLAERIAYGMAQGLLKARPIVPASWPATVALLEAAHSCAPTEPRIDRMLIEALLRAGDSKRALEVLTEYRATDEGKDDEGAQTQTIDLYLTQLQDVQRQIEYLQSIVGRAGISDSVKSYAALRCAELMAEHMQDKQSMQMVDQALRLNPLNLRALRIKYETTLKNGTPTERLQGMLAMLKSNPAQPALLLAVAQDLADAGLIQPAIQWYNVALGTYPRTELRTPGREVVLDFASLIYISGDAKTAEQIASRITAAESDSLNAWLLRLIMAHAAGDKDALASLSRQAQIALTNRLAMLRRQAGDATATTRPVDPTSDVPAVDVPATLAQIQKANKPDLVDQFAMVAQTMAWVKIYFEDKPADAEPWIMALAKIAPSDPTIARLQGWQLLKQGKNIAARAKLEPIAKEDPLAEAGLIMLAENTPAAQDRANSEGRQVLSAHPSGLTGAALYEMLSARGIRLIPGPLADQLSAELAKFPRDLLTIIDQPQNFYALRLEPVHNALQPGDPLLLRVIIMNTGDFDLAVGPDEILHNDLWFDAQLRGADQQYLGSESFDRITKRIVLPSKQTMSQVIRLDTSQLTLLLLTNPQKFFQISAACMTNPTMLNGQITNGPGGYRVTLPNTRLMEREAAPYNKAETVQKVDQDLANGTPEQKVQALELVATFYSLLQQIDDPHAKELAGHFADEIRHGTTETDPTVRAWAFYVLSFLAGDKDLPVIVRTMVQDPAWQVRMLAEVLVELRGAPRTLFKSLLNDPNPWVKKLAESFDKMPIVKRPATQPAAPANNAPANMPSVPAAPAPGAVPAPAPVSPPAPATPPSVPSNGGSSGISTTPPPAGAAPTGGPGGQ